MTKPKNPAAYAVIQAALDQVLQKGSYTRIRFPSAGKAASWRQSAHKFRKLLQERDGWTSYDHLVFSIPKDSPEVLIIRTIETPELEFLDTPLVKGEVPTEFKQNSPLAQKIQAYAASGLAPDAIWEALVPQAGDEELRLAFVEADVKLPDHVEVF